ncbi:HNH homing endonuclease [Rathayibacter phage NCPPB3778]|nr:HNH homing endonuclease [Rathayibacter phage NCPPB3778]
MSSHSVEVWLPVVRYEGIYEVSDQGRVRSLDRLSLDGRQLIGAILSPATTHDGYKRVTLSNRLGEKHALRVHRIVAWSFIGVPEDDDLVVMHKNDVRDDNRATNLEWGTVSENAQHRSLRGRNPGPQEKCRKGLHPMEDSYKSGENRYCRQCALVTRAAWRARQKPTDTP